MRHPVEILQHSLMSWGNTVRRLLPSRINVLLSVDAIPCDLRQFDAPSLLYATFYSALCDQEPSYGSVPCHVFQRAFLLLVVHPGQSHYSGAGADGDLGPAI